MRRTIARWYGGILWRGAERAFARPEEVQRRLLARLVRDNAETAFGREHRFASIGSLEDYRRQVPLRRFPELSPWFDRAVNGEQGVLTREPVVFFNESSGTSGKKKKIPVTRSWARDVARLRLIWGTQADQAHPKLLAGKTISIVYSASEGRTPGGVEYGAATGRVFQQSPASVRRRYALPYAVALIGDPESKQYAAMRLALAQNVTFLFCTNPAAVLSLVQAGDRRKEELLRDIHDGTLNRTLDLPDGVRDSLAPLCRPDPEAARRLERMAERRAGRLLPMDYWPDCAVLGCWLGSTVGTTARDIPAWFGPGLALRDLGLAASEGTFTLPVADNIAHGALTVDSCYYEFIPLEEAEREAPTLLNAWELQDGGEYLLVITTRAGLYRYHMNDVVRVRGWLHRTPMLEFLRRGGDATNLVGEKMDVSHVLGAVAMAQRASGLEIAHFRVQADAEAWRYRFHVELRGDAPQDAREVLTGALEEALQVTNLSYRRGISENLLQPLEVCLMRPGWFDRYVEAALAGGARHGQFKPILLTMQPEPGHEKA